MTDTVLGPNRWYRLSDALGMRLNIEAKPPYDVSGGVVASVSLGGSKGAHLRFPLTVAASLLSLSGDQAALYLKGPGSFVVIVVHDDVTKMLSCFICDRTKIDAMAWVSQDFGKSENIDDFFSLYYPIIVAAYSKTEYSATWAKWPEGQLSSYVAACKGGPDAASNGAEAMTG